MNWSSSLEMIKKMACEVGSNEVEESLVCVCGRCGTPGYGYM